MTGYTSMKESELRQELESLMQLYEDYQQMKLALNMSPVSYTHLPCLFTIL